MNFIIEKVLCLLLCLFNTFQTFATNEKRKLNSNSINVNNSIINKTETFFPYFLKNATKKEFDNFFELRIKSRSRLKRALKSKLKLISFLLWIKLKKFF